MAMRVHINLPTTQQYSERLNLMDVIFVFKSQPSNSPDFNVLDLGYFLTLQAQQYIKRPRVEHELVQRAQMVFKSAGPG